MNEQLLEIGKRLVAETDVGRVLSSGIDGLIELTGAERGMVILFDEGGQARFETARSLERADLERPEFEVSRTLLAEVQERAEPIYLHNALDDPRLRQSRSAHRLKILSIICLPLLGDQAEPIGVVYLDNRSVQGAFEAEHFELARSFADFISLAARHALERRRLQDRVEGLEHELRASYSFEAIVGQHPALLAALKTVAQVAPSDATVLIQGETGTGKELLARALHANSRRSRAPFVPINCGALPESLLDSELFGHVRGAFTGAASDRIGWFEQANGGTLFFDEISKMTFTLQEKLLRVLQNGEYAPVGSSELRWADVRVVAATNRDLQALVEKGEFRQDLYYRLRVVDVVLPPLRERRSDIPLLLRHFLRTFGARYDKELRVSAAVSEALSAYDFPGNVRELENLVHRGAVLAEGGTIELHHLPPEVLRPPAGQSAAGASSGFRAEKERVIAAFERQYLEHHLRLAEGNVTRAARLAELNVKNFHAKLRKYGIRASRFKPGR